MQETRIQSLGQGGSPGEGNSNPLVFLPEKSHGQRSLAGYSPKGCKELGMTEHMHTELTVSGCGLQISDYSCLYKSKILGS